ncbi:MAG: PEP-CTERM sorting domain-containing protein [Akkermansia sp.]
MLIKRTIVALLTLAGVSFADGTQLTLTSPSNGNLTSKNAAIQWSEDYNSLTSWELSFTTTDSDLADTTYRAYFGTRQNTNESGIALEVTSGGALKLLTKNYPTGETNPDWSYTTDNGWVTQGQQVTITLSFVADVVNINNKETVTAGIFTLSAGNNTVSTQKITDADVLKYTSLLNDGTSRLYTGAGKHPYSNITVSKLDNVPEPATATLSLMALAGLAARRRRK